MTISLFSLFNLQFNVNFFYCQVFRFVDLSINNVEILFISVTFRRDNWGNKFFILIKTLPIEATSSALEVPKSNALLILKIWNVRVFKCKIWCSAHYYKKKASYCLHSIRKPFRFPGSCELYNWMGYIVEVFLLINWKIYVFIFNRHLTICTTLFTRNTYSEEVVLLLFIGEY